MKLFEMEGFLRGKCLPGDMKVNETNAEYLVRKFAEADARCAALAAESSGMSAFVDALLSIAWQGGSADGADIQELAMKHGLLRQEVYSADEHENQVNDPGNFEDGDPVYFRVETPEADAFLAEVRAQAKADGVQEYADSFRHSASKIRECHGDTIRVRALLHEANNADEFASQLRKGVQS
ncbi:hypothetical protein N4235_23370 [Enterobacter asburiae]|uniref:hypothetical protein n=1 Tax=Enterobacter asburiae TaxID=61645 RepID=UPI0029667849|nr:hypothetical protein [Enterobacter asburiae]MDW3573812.1 hypothetical protein [Enterobacter asburiae]